MSHTLVFQCPHCGETMEVPEQQAGETTVCSNPSCGRPFRADVPTGQFVGTRNETAGQDAPNRSQNRNQSAGDADEGRYPGIGRDEQVLLTVHPAMIRRHPFWFLTYVLLLVGGVFGAVFFGLAGQEPLALTCGALALAGLVLLGLWYLQVLNVTLQLTTKRSIVRRGLFSKETSEVRHEDVRNLQVDQSFLERILGVGDVAISSAGQDDLEIRVEGVTHPTRVLELIREHQD